MNDDQERSCHLEQYLELGLGNLLGHAVIGAEAVHVLGHFQLHLPVVDDTAACVLDDDGELQTSIPILPIGDELLALALVGVGPDHFVGSPLLVTLQKGTHGNDAGQAEWQHHQQSQAQGVLHRERM